MSITDNFVQVVMSSLTGDVAELVCSVRGKPTPEVHWRKAGELDLVLGHCRQCVLVDDDKC